MPEATCTKIGMVMTTFSMNGNRRELALTSVQSLLDHTNMSVHVLYVMDDGSQDGLGEALEERFGSLGHIRIFRSAENLGVGMQKYHGCRRMIRDWPDVEFLYICDDDLLYQDGWLEHALAIYRDIEREEPIGLLGLWRHPVHEVIEGYPWPRDPRFTILKMTDVPGCCVLVRREHYQRAGGWNGQRRGDDVLFTRKLQALGLPLFAVTPPLLLHEGYIYADGSRIEYPKEQSFENSQHITIRNQP